MPNQVFYKLPIEKRSKIESALYKEFSDYPLEVTQVKRIIQDARIPRGSFYQYFKDIDDAFVYVLSLIKKDIIEKHIEQSINNPKVDKLTLIKENFKNRILLVFSNLSKTNEHKVVDQIRNSEKAIDIFLEQLGLLPNMTSEEISKLFVDENTEKYLQLNILPEILFPTLKITLSKLFKKEINVQVALEEIDLKVEIIRVGIGL